jgi:hypothetical protein
MGDASRNIGEYAVVSATTLHVQDAYSVNLAVGFGTPRTRSPVGLHAGPESIPEELLAG